MAFRIQFVSYLAVWQLCFTAVLAAIESDDPQWGKPDKGLQIRILAIATETDEQNPDFAKAKRTNEFKLADDVTLLVQFKNVSNKPISFQGVRYGRGVSDPWPGKSRQSEFGALLFDVRIFDQQGKLVEPPSAKTSETLAMLEISSGSAEALPPNDSATMLLKPIQWDASVAATLAAGKYQLEIAYNGTPESIQARIKKHWPDHPLGNVWHGRAVSPRIDIRIQKSYRDLRPKLAWGKPKNGLRVAAEYRLSDTRAENPLEFIDRVFPVGSQINVRYFFQNTSRKTIKFKSELWRQDDEILIVTDDGTKKVSHPWYSGIARTKTWTIEPKQIISVDAIPLSFPPEKEDPSFNAMGAEIKSGPGEYRIRHRLKGQELSTGTTLPTMRSRKPSDEPKTYAATLIFRKPDGSFAKNGFVKVRTQEGGKQLFAGELKGEALELKNWMGESLAVYARISGCEENTFYDINPDKGGTTPILLTASNPIMMKLIDENDKPVANANVRYFIRTGVESRNYPFPTNGIQGPVYASSDQVGVVKLDSVQSGYIYTFYIEPEALAPMFIKGVSVGTDLGTIKLSPPFEVSGIIKGTPEQLKRFAAEWDQPIPLVLSDGSTSSLYAVSKKLQATRDGDQLRFRIPDLRPGKLRIIANFGPKPHSVAHIYARRKVGPTDELFEFELDGPRDDIVIKAKSK